ncbi:Leptomycin B resistance protein pmd1-like protein 8 [Colletotrichum chlorophyti]|uniref:Leptomycin B resistance protein pmd1-like protein 8 n=1 Tax=Colletotrichum chlorophyti TaxID=708187 RepID=A0A1Q8S0J0_9PEZI|nr:Leptomycin B resistance protein pmd1-like protein 8 [Colletotrichum chlorophyti]
MIGAGTALPLMDIVFGRDEINRFTRRLYDVYLFVAKFVLTYMWTFIIAVTAMRTTKALRVDFLRQTLRQDVFFFDLPVTSSVSGQVNKNGNLINQGISEKLGLIIQACSMFITAFIVAFAIQWKLTLIIVGIVPVNLAVTAVCVVYNTVYEYRIFDIYSQAGALAQEVFASIRTVHSFWAYPKLSKKFEAVLEEARTIGRKKLPVYAILFSVEFFCIYCGYGLAFWQGILAEDEYSTGATDNIVVINDGQIVEQGSHSRLLELNGAYARLEVIKAYKLELFENTLKQEMSFFDEPMNTAGALVSRLSREPTNLQEPMSANLGLIFVNIVNLASSCVLAIAVGWKLGLVLVFGALPPLVFSGWLRIRLEYKLDNDTAARFAESSGLAAEAVTAIRTVSSLGLERNILDSQSVSFLTMALGFCYGGRLLPTGEYTSSQFYTGFIAVIFSGESAAIFFQFSTSITKARVSTNYIFNLRRLLSPRSDDEGEDDDAPSKCGRNGTVACHDVDFSYPQRSHVKVLKGVNTVIESGQFAAFVGASGCGKTTLISLLERFYDPTNGTISFGGVPIRTQGKRDYRKKLALVPQEPVLYQESIRENIKLGIDSLKEPAERDIMETCRQANIHEFITSLPEGLDTWCGSQGFQLSGGQRQRIAIARALIRQPVLLLLDESTSALDSASEKVVKAALNQAAEGRTTISVAHRLSTIKDADIIFAFSHGRIVESGKHEQLLQKKGMYYDMCLGQSLDRTA